MIRVILLLLFTIQLQAGTASLRYLPDQPVSFKSTLNIDISQSLPGLSLSTKGKQHFDAEMIISQDQEGLAVLSPPFDIVFLLKGIKIDVQANGEDLHFDSKDKGNSLYLSQLSKLIDAPLHLHFGENYQIVGKNIGLNKSLEELPMLQEIDPVKILSELFLHLFGPAGKPLKEGDVIERNISEGLIPSLPEKVTYTVTKIDDYHIYADIQGTIEKKKFDLLSLVKLQEKELASVSATLSGTIVGKIIWNRDNAMLHDLKLDYAYSARLQLAQWEWLMNVNLNLNNQTHMVK